MRNAAKGNQMFRKLLTGVGASVALLASGGASAAFEDFCVNSLAIGGTTSTATYASQTTNAATGCVGVGANAGTPGFTADALNGRYAERLVVTAGLGGVLNFQSTVFVTWGLLARNNGGNPYISAQSLLGSQYNMYSVVRASGTLALGQFNATNASIELWADQFSVPGADITAQTPAAWDALLNPILSGAGDDQLLLSGSFLDGFGSATSPGRFTFMFDAITLTGLGSNYFIAPRPFHLNVLSDGDVDTAGFNVTGPGQFDLVGDVSANFYRIPEPGSLALAGLALLGLAAVRSRKK